jgi:hypothetical protein
VYDQDQTASSASLASLFLQIGDYSLANHQYYQAERSYQAALAASIQAHESSVDLAIVLKRISATCLLQGKLADANRLSTEAELLLAEKRYQMERSYQAPSFIPPPRVIPAMKKMPVGNIVETVIGVLICILSSVVILACFRMPMAHSIYTFLH